MYLHCVNSTRTYFTLFKQSFVIDTSFKITSETSPVTSCYISFFSFSCSWTVWLKLFHKEVSKKIEFRRAKILWIIEFVQSIENSLTSQTLFVKKCNCLRPEIKEANLGWSNLIETELIKGIAIEEKTISPSLKWYFSREKVKFGYNR